MDGTQLVIVNGTDDDAICNVSGGPGGWGGDGMQWKVPKKKTVKLPPSLPVPCTLRFSIDIGEKKVTQAMKGLKLTRGKKGLQIEVVKKDGKEQT